VAVKIPKVRVWVSDTDKLETPDFFHRIVDEMQKKGVDAFTQKQFLTEWFKAEPGQYADLYKKWVIVTVRKPGETPDDKEK